jgi:hypothetical protein
MRVRASIHVIAKRDEDDRRQIRPESAIATAQNYSAREAKNAIAWKLMALAPSGPLSPAAIIYELHTKRSERERAWPKLE